MKDIGVIGLGIMGSAMARNLLKAGYRVHVFNRSERKTAELETAGAINEKTPRQLSEKCSVIMVIVSDPAAVWAVLDGADGVFAVNGSGKTIIQHSTLDLETTLRAAGQAGERGYLFLDCPVTGSKKQVEAAELILEAGGDAALVKEMEPILLAIGKRIVHAGPIGSGTALKLCMNLIVAQMTTGICEAVALAGRLGVDPAHIFEVLSSSPALNCIYFNIKKEPLLSGLYPPAFSLSNMLKDVRFMNKEAKGKGLNLPVTQAVQGLMENALSKGFGAEDLTAILKALS